VLSSSVHRPLWTDNLLAKPHERWAELADDTIEVPVPVSLDAEQHPFMPLGRGW
jgi:hypothetical protein